MSPLGDGENGASMGLPHVDGPLCCETPVDDAAVGVAREQKGVVAHKLEAVNVRCVAAQDAAGQGGLEGGSGHGVDKLR